MDKTEFINKMFELARDFYETKSIDKARNISYKAFILYDKLFIDKLKKCEDNCLKNVNFNAFTNSPLFEIKVKKESRQLKNTMKR